MIINMLLPHFCRVREASSLGFALLDSAFRTHADEVQSAASKVTAGLGRDRRQRRGGNEGENAMMNRTEKKGDKTS